MAAIQNRYRQEVQYRQADVEQNHEVERQPVIALHIGGQHRQNPRRPAQVFDPYAGLFGVEESGNGLVGSLENAPDVLPRPGPRPLHGIGQLPFSSQINREFALPAHIGRHNAEHQIGHSSLLQRS